MEARERHDLVTRSSHHVTSVQSGNPIIQDAKGTDIVGRGHTGGINLQPPMPITRIGSAQSRIDQLTRRRQASFSRSAQWEMQTGPNATETLAMSTRTAPSISTPNEASLPATCAA